MGPSSVSFESAAQLLAASWNTQLLALKILAEKLIRERSLLFRTYESGVVAEGAAADVWRGLLREEEGDTSVAQRRRGWGPLLEEDGWIGLDGIVRDWIEFGGLVGLC